MYMYKHYITLLLLPSTKKAGFCSSILWRTEDATCVTQRQIITEERVHLQDNVCTYTVYMYTSIPRTHVHVYVHTCTVYTCTCMWMYMYMYIPQQWWTPGSRILVRYWWCGLEWHAHHEVAEGHSHSTKPCESEDCRSKSAWNKFTYNYTTIPIHLHVHCVAGI